MRLLIILVSANCLIHSTDFSWLSGGENLCRTVCSQSIKVLHQKWSTWSARAQGTNRLRGISVFTTRWHISCYYLCRPTGRGKTVDDRDKWGSTMGAVMYMTGMIFGHSSSAKPVAREQPYGKDPDTRRTPDKPPRKPPRQPPKPPRKPPPDYPPEPPREPPKPPKEDPDSEGHVSAVGYCKHERI